MAEHFPAMVLFRHVSLRERWESGRPARARALAVAAICLAAVVLLVA